MLLRPEPYRIDNRLVGARFDFTRATRPISPLITFSRASSATYFDSAGVLQTAGSGVARAHAFQDHNPSTLAPLGFLIEEARTNSIRNNTMVGASAPNTKPTNWVIAGAGIGTLTETIVGTGTIGGIEYIDVRYSGTTSTTGFLLGFDANTQIAALQNQVWSNSIYFAVVGGNATNITSIFSTMIERSGAGASLNNNNSADLKGSSSTLSRVATTATLSQATTAFLQPGILFSFASGVAIDITLRIGLPQLELGAFATSPIKTSGSAATRLADSASITGAAFSSIWNQSEGTVVVAGDMMAPAVAAHGPYRIDDGTDSERIMLRDSGAGLLGYVVIDGGVTQANLSTGNTVVANTPFKHAAAYKLNDIATSYNGAAVLTDTGATIPTVNRILLGVGGTTTSYMNGHLQSLTYYRKRLSPNSVLQTLTTP